MPHDPNVEFAVDDSIHEALQRHDGRMQHTQCEYLHACERIVPSIEHCRQPAHHERRNIDSEVVDHAVVGVARVFVLATLQSCLHVSFHEHQQRAHRDRAGNHPEIQSDELPPKLFVVVTGSGDHDPAPESRITKFVNYQRHMGADQSVHLEVSR